MRQFAREVKSAVLASTVLGMLLVASPAWAFRTGSDLIELKGSASKPVGWALLPMPYRIHTELPRGISAEDMSTAVVRAAATWGAPACSRAEFTAEGFTDAPAIAGDHLNTLQWLFSGWEEHGFPSDAAGATDILYEKDVEGRWRIVEADVYLNATAREWVLEAPVPEGKWDLVSAITHELGHFAGLLHPCELDAAGGAPGCDGSLPIAATTMYPEYSSEQSTLDGDDVAGICFLYPVVDCGKEACPAGTSCTKEGCQAPCGDTFCSSGEECQRGTCSRPDPPSPCDSAAAPSACSPSCQRDADCADGQSCRTGKCARALGVLGDPCRAGDQCASAACNDAGACVTPCSADVDCGGRGECQIQDSGGSGVCSAAALPFGASCKSADDCAGGQCLAGYTDAAQCTRLCGPSADRALTCPEGWACNEIEGRSVCTPRQGGSGCSCRLAQPSGQSPVALFGGAVLLGSFFEARRRAGKRPRLDRSVKPPPRKWRGG